MLTAHFDESYNNRTMCVGGWLGTDVQWQIVRERWQERIEYENRISTRKTLKPLSRHHAADCSSLTGEFRDWTIERQIKFSKKLLRIIERSQINGLAVGISYGELNAAFPEIAGEKPLKWFGYAMCMMECLATVGEIMHAQYPNECVAIIYEGGTKFNGAAKFAYDGIFKSLVYSRTYGKYFAAISPMKWQDCISLQPADLVAYEGFKLTDAQKRGNFDIRRSLQAILGSNIPLVAKYFSAEGLHYKHDAEATAHLYQ